MNLISWIPPRPREPVTDMRWIWIDTFVEFVPGKQASAIKNVTLAEDPLYDFRGGLGAFPPSLMIEGMAQTAGMLVGEARGFRENVILAKIRSATFEDYAVAGDQLRYDAVLESLDERAGMTCGTVLRNGKSIGTVNLIFSHVNRADKSVGLPDENFVFTEEFMNLLRAFQPDKADWRLPTDGQ